MCKKTYFILLFTLFANIVSAQQIVDILVAYTNHCQSYKTDTQTVEIINKAVLDANNSFVSSGIDMQYNLVKIIKITFEEDNKTAQQIWNEFSNNNTILNLRDEYNADLCFLVFNNSTETGMGKIPPSDDPNATTSNIGFAVGNISKVEKIFTLAHELGHCFGARHNFENDNQGSYNHGYIAPDGSWGTIMSYVSDPENKRINKWSNPNMYYNGIPMGDNYSNNTQWLNEQKSDIANYLVPVLSGNLAKNQTLAGRSYSLSGDLNIPSGITFKLLSSASIIFNGFKITQSGGTIVLENGSPMSANVVKNSSGTILEVNNNSLQSTIDNTANGNTVEKYENTQYTLTSNILVPSNKTLIIKTYNIYYVNNYSIYSTGGTISLENGATINGLEAYLKSGSTLKGLFPTIQSAINSASSNQTIELLTATYSESPSFSSKFYITLSGQGTGSTILNNGLSVNNSNNIYIDNIRMNGSVSVNSSQLVHVSNCLIPSATMLYDYYSTQTNLASSSSGTEEQASYAVTSYGGTGDIFLNTIRRFDVGVFLAWGASYNVGDQNTFCNNGVDIYSPSPSYAYAISNNYSFALPNCVYGNVFVTGTNGICSLPKISHLQLSETNYVESKLLKDADEKYLTLLRKITDDSKKEKYDKNKYLNDYTNLVEDYKKVINQEKEIQTVKAALSKLNHLFKAVEDKKSFASYLAVLSNGAATQQFMPYIKRYSIWDAVNNSDYNNSISIADEVLKLAGNDEDLTCEMIYEKGLIYKYYLNDTNKAEELFAGLIVEHPQHLLAKYASFETGIEVNQQIGLKKTTSEQITNYSLDNYPNPFNPTTTISYSLPQPGHVILKVYDVLGREIAELVNSVKEKGSHTVMFDASKLASGIYIYTLRVNDYYTSRKMLLTK